MVNEVFLYTLFGFKKHMSLLWGNFLHCLSSVGKCVYTEQFFIRLNFVICRNFSFICDSWTINTSHIVTCCYHWVSSGSAWSPRSRRSWSPCSISPQSPGCPYCSSSWRYPPCRKSCVSLCAGGQYMICILITESISMHASRFQSWYWPLPVVSVCRSYPPSPNRLQDVADILRECFHLDNSIIVIVAGITLVISLPEQLNK